MTIEIIIHRGTKQIGGCVTEIRTEEARIFIDLGSELPDIYGNTPPETLSIDGVTQAGNDCDGVFFTHYHGDHIGMISLVMPHVPLYMGQATKEIHLTYQRRINRGHIPADDRIRTFWAKKEIRIKDLSVTPFLVDHSAYDAYMFLIKGHGMNILHTGDFRTHGFRGKAVIPMLEKYVGQVDVLIIEGTSLSNDRVHSIDEGQLQKEARKLLSAYKYVFVLCSSTNIDRIASFHEATPLGKYFLCDKYQKDIIDIAKKYGEEHSSLYSFNKALVYGKNLKDKVEQRGFCMVVRSSGWFLDIMKDYRENHDPECLLIYSMWDGYLRQSVNGLQSLMDSFQHSIHLHTSGHATTDAIIDVCNTVRPKRAIIPIHTFNPTKLDALGLPFHIEYLADGQVFEVN